jgi:hypothetical protein
MRCARRGLGLPCTPNAALSEWESDRKRRAHKQHQQRDLRGAGRHAHASETRGRWMQVDAPERLNELLLDFLA